ncbi:MAG TPA: prepilin-type N-terminal cleavage/methylation domain-containing protein [Candidatus Methylomirabilis sp.]|nr:prepilin-type N-terminal cleavage/methylation domain-containing protein [Candidatus Methylomirabilis sp.]
MTRHHQKTGRSKASSHGGFTLTEVLIALIVLLVGIVAVAQLVPVSVGSNSATRNDSSALVFAQRELDQFLAQPLNMTVAPPSFTDAEGNLCDLGDPTQPNIVVGSPTTTFYNQLVINFAAAATTGYSFTYQDPNDPAGVFYDARWAVITTKGANGMVTSKRFILGVRKQGGNWVYRPVTLDTILEK